MKKVVSNATVLIGLSRVAQLELLSQLFGEINISLQVYEEVVSKGKGRPGEKEVKNADWIKKIPAKTLTQWEKYRSALSEADTSVLALGSELKADLVLLDDLPLYEIALKQGFQLARTGRILIEAKNQNLIPDVKSILDKMIEQGFLLSKKTYVEILREAEEK